MKSIAIHQPNYLPWLGYFHKIQLADEFVILDDVDYQSGNATSITNRTRIKTANGETLLTIPVLKNHESRHINQVRIDNKQPWPKKHLRTLQMAYAKSPHFDEVYALIEAVLSREFERLAPLNQSLIGEICGYLELETPLRLSSSLDGVQATEKNERIIEICQSLGATAYFSGSGAREYNDEALYLSHNIKLDYTRFAAPVYPQLHGEFVAGLSIVDALFNCGRETKALLQGEPCQ